MQKNQTFQFSSILSIVLFLSILINGSAAQNVNKNGVQANQKKSELKLDKYRMMPQALIKTTSKINKKVMTKDILLFEDFTGLTELPEGWTVVGEGEENWNVIESNLAGGELPEIYFNFSPDFVGNSKLVTPEINTSGKTHLLLVYNQFFENYSSTGGETLKVETTSDGITWNEVWTHVANSNLGPEVNELAISNSDVGSENFQIAFTFDGNTYEINWWMLDNIELSDMLTYDAATVGIGLPGSISVGSVQIPTAIVRNYGSANASFDVTMSIYDGTVEVYTSTANVSGLTTLEEAIIEFDPWIPANVGIYTATAISNLAGDENSDNDAFSKEVEVIDGFSFAEEFDSGVFPPDGWTVVGDEVDNWYQSETDYAGGDIPEASFTWDPLFIGTSRLITPEINSEGLESILLIFKHYLHDYAGGYSLSVESTSDGGNTWNELWLVVAAGDIGPETIIIPFSNPDVGSENLQIAFTFEGDNYNIWNWYIDDIYLLDAPDWDVAAGDISGIPEVNPIGAELTTKVIVNNYSIEPVSFDVTLTINDGVSNVFTSTLTVNDAPLIEDIEVTFDTWTAEVVGEFTATVETFLSNDQNPENDTSSYDFSVIDGAYRNLVVFEDFTGTWCGFCPGAQMGIRDLIAFGYPVAGIAWHDNDPYETQESIERISYYGITGFPTVWADGIEEFVGGSADSSAWAWYAPFVDLRMTQPTTIGIDYSNTNFDGTTFTADVEMEALGIVSSDNLVMHAVLTESHIPETWQTQYELLEAQRLTFAGSTGTPVDLINQTTQTVSISFDIEESWIPEFCEVVMFVQDTETQEIFNGNKVHVKEQTYFPSVTFTVHDQNGVNIEGANVDLGEFSLETGSNGEAVFSDLEAGPYFYYVSADGYEPAVVEGVYVVQLEDEIIDIELTGTTIINEVQLNRLEFFPNPAGDYITINGFEDAIVNIYDLAGKLQITNKLSNSITLDISELENGNYIIMVVDDNNLQTGRLTIIK